MSRAPQPSRSRVLFLAAIAGIAGAAAAGEASAAVVIATPTEDAAVSGVVPLRVAMAPGDRIRETRVSAGRREIVRAVTFQNATAGLTAFVNTAILGEGATALSVGATTRAGRTLLLRRRVTVSSAAAPVPIRSSAFRFSVPRTVAAGAPPRLRFSAPLGNRADRVEVFLDGRLIARAFFRPGAFASLSTFVPRRRLRTGTHVLRAAVRANGRVKRFGKVFAAPKTRRVVPRPAPPAPSPAGPLPGTLAFVGDFETGDFTQWRNDKGYQSKIQAQAPDRVQIVRSPVAQGSYAARFEVREGDQAANGNRAEVLHNTNEHEGDERWYQWQTMFDPSFPRNSRYQLFTQWHAAQGGTQAMVRFNANVDKITFSTVESTSARNPGGEKVHWSGPMNRGTWHTFRLHAKWSTNRSVGFVELYYNGQLVVPQTPVATMIPGIDRAYVKQGLYRSDKTTGTSVVFHDGFTMSAVK